MGIIAASSDGPERPFTFTHELVRQTMLAGIAAPRRQHLHAAVAGAIARLHPDAVNEHAGDIAIHLVKAGAFASGVLAPFHGGARRSSIGGCEHVGRQGGSQHASRAPESGSSLPRFVTQPPLASDPNGPSFPRG